ncbi:hypothetical protein K432DRAFT_303826, partial [Lepidopterella palustris CBS 459.81]
KVNLQGLDNLNTGDVKRFASEHFSLDQFIRVEWINDTSANLLYETADAALQALNAFSKDACPDAFSIPESGMPTKGLSSHPNAELKVRLATVKDVKAPRAREASRFYLLNPEYDPSERKRNPRGRGGRPSDDRGDYTKRHFDDREHRRRRGEGDRAAFDVSMYDDDAGSSMINGSRNGRDVSQTSYTSSGEDGYRKRVRFRGRRETDLFASGTSDGRLRDRSASPDPDGDGRMGFPEDENSIRRRIRQRTKSSTLLSSSASNGKELFPNRSSPPKRSKELFPHKTDISNHRRTDATDETANMLASRMTVPFGDGSAGPRSRSLADRITPNQPDDMNEDAAKPEEITIRGSAEQTPGFSIRGAAQAADTSSTELFPRKPGAGNFGKELFGEKIKGRGGPRRKAEDMFF